MTAHDKVRTWSSSWPVSCTISAFAWKDRVRQRIRSRGYPVLRTSYIQGSSLIRISTVASASRIFLPKVISVLSMWTPLQFVLISIPRVNKVSSLRRFLLHPKFIGIMLTLGSVNIFLRSWVTRRTLLVSLSSTIATLSLMLRRKLPPCKQLSKKSFILP